MHLAEPEVVDRLRPAWVEVDLDALVANLGLLRRRAAGARAMAVVKADAYGHGAVPVARALAAAGADWLAVAMVEEGAELRRAGIETPVLVLGPVFPEQVAACRAHRLTPAISGLDQLAWWAEATAGGGEPQEVHLKLDTGMGRLGIALRDLSAALEMLAASPGLRLAGVMSHLAESEELASERTRRQRERFVEALGTLRPEQRRGLVVHLANSGGALHHPEARFDLVRLGLALYGLDPARREGWLRPVMAVKARVVLERQVPAGSLLGYNGRWRAPRPSRVGVLPLGYADGYPWRLTHGGAEALLAGRRVPVVGAVSMDMTLVDLTAGAARAGDEAVLLGRQGDEEVTAWELAERASTIPYEILTGFRLRLSRHYLRGGAVESVALARGEAP